MQMGRAAPGEDHWLMRFRLNGPPETGSHANRYKTSQVLRRTQVQGASAVITGCKNECTGQLTLMGLPASMQRESASSSKRAWNSRTQCSSTSRRCQLPRAAIAGAAFSAAAMALRTRARAHPSAHTTFAWLSASSHLPTPHCTDWHGRLAPAIACCPAQTGWERGAGLGFQPFSPGDLLGAGHRHPVGDLPAVLVRHLQLLLPLHGLICQVVRVAGHLHASTARSAESVKATSKGRLFMRLPHQGRSCTASSKMRRLGRSRSHAGSALHADLPPLLLLQWRHAWQPATLRVLSNSADILIAQRGRRARTVSTGCDSTRACRRRCSCGRGVAGRPFSVACCCCCASASARNSSALFSVAARCLFSAGTCTGHAAEKLSGQAASWGEHTDKQSSLPGHLPQPLARFCPSLVHGPSVWPLHFLSLRVPAYWEQWVSCESLPAIGLLAGANPSCGDVDAQ